MEKQEIKNKVLDILHGRGFDDANAEDQDLINDLAMDSLDMVELLMDCEKTFSISIKDEHANTWDTIGDVIKTIDEYIN